MVGLEGAVHAQGLNACGGLEHLMWGVAVSHQVVSGGRGPGFPGSREGLILAIPKPWQAPRPDSPVHRAGRHADAGKAADPDCGTASRHRNAPVGTALKPPQGATAARQRRPLAGNCFRDPRGRIE